MGPSASRIRMNTLPLGKAAWATRTVSSGIGKSGDAGNDIAYLLDRANLLTQSSTELMGGQPILHPVCDMVSYDSFHQGLGGVRQQSQCWVYPMYAERSSW